MYNEILYRMKKWSKILLWLMLTPLITFVLSAVLLYIPPVQRWAIDQATSYASNELGMDIRIDRVRVSFPLDLELQGLQVIHQGEALGSMGSMVVDLDLMRILLLQIRIEGIELKDLDVETGNLIESVRINGNLNRIFLKAEQINLLDANVSLAQASIEGGDVTICLADTTAADTTESSPLPWNIGIEKVRLDRLNLSLQMPLDSLDLGLQIREGELNDGNIDLLQGIYQADDIHIKTDTIRYNAQTDTLEHAGIDFTQILLTEASLQLNSPFYNQTSNAAGASLMLTAKERCGLAIDTLSANIGLDSTTVWADDLLLKTPFTRIEAATHIGLAAFQSYGTGRIDAQILGDIGNEDIRYFVANHLLEDELKALPQAPLHLNVNVNGTTELLQLSQFTVAMPGIIEAHLEGSLSNVKNWNRSDALLTAELQTHNLECVKKLLKTDGLELPAMKLTAKLDKKSNLYAAEAQLQESDGSIVINGKADVENMTYEARAEINEMKVDHFFPRDSVHSLSGGIEIKGKGTDFLSPKTSLSAKANLEDLQYKKWTLNNVEMTANLHKGTGIIDFMSDNELLKIHACTEAKIDRMISKADFSLNLNHIDLYALNLSRDTLSASMIMKMDGSTNFKDNHHLEGSIQAMELMMSDTVYHPLDLSMKLLLEPDSIYVNASAGDLLLSVNSEQGYKDVLNRIGNFTEELDRQRHEYYINQDTLRTLLPHLALHLHSGKRNPMHNILQYMTGYSYNDLLLEVDASPAGGLQGEGHVYSLHTGKIPVDTIRWDIFQDSAGVNMKGRISNNPKNRVAVFESNWFAHITPTGMVAGLDFLDEKKKKGVDFGMRADVMESGMKLSFTPINPIIAYRRFTLNEDNFIMLNKNKKVDALVDLLADDGTGLKLYSTPNDEALQDISLEVNRINLGELSSVLPYLPNMAGFLNGDMHYLQSDSTLSVSADMNIKAFKLENSPIGDLGISAVYLPNSDGTHFVDGMVSHDGEDALYLNGKYHHTEDGDAIEAMATLVRLPLRLANGFIPDKMIELDGFAKGEIDISGALAAPVVNGSLLTESMKVSSVPYSLNLTFPDDTIHIKQNIIDLDRIEAYAAGKNPLVLDGTIDLKNQEKIKLDLAVRAQNYELINAHKSRDAQAYGKVFVDIGAIMRGTLDDIRLRGKLTVLGKTDVTYVLKDSPISAEDQLSELVEFVDMSDTLVSEQKVVMASPQKMDMIFTVEIEQAAQVHCLLSESGSDYVNLEGGGELTLSYDNQNNLLLNGRYTILEGDMKYSLMELVSKHFTIQPNSYVEFHGNIMNPSLHIKASERVKTTVTENNVPRSVNFDVGLSLSQTLENMGLEFTLDAPEDMSIQNELAAMSVEQRGRVAVTMLATGIYLTDNYKASGVSSTNALYNYLQSQVNAIAGKALKTVDINFGIENTINQTGSTQTDYNFSFAKRFWGNRVRLIIGGKVSSGDNVVNNGQSIIDNVSLEYRLDNSATRYVKLYYDKNYESLLEGELVEMGAGAVFRRKSAKLGDLFIFRKKKK